MTGDSDSHKFRLFRIAFRKQEKRNRSRIEENTTEIEESKRVLILFLYLYIIILYIKYKLSLSPFSSEREVAENRSVTVTCHPTLATIPARSDFSHFHARFPSDFRLQRYNFRQTNNRARRFLFDSLRLFKKVSFTLFFFRKVWWFQIKDVTLHQLYRTINKTNYEEAKSFHSSSRRVL